jgi:prophage regulatory protein
MEAIIMIKLIPLSVVCDMTGLRKSAIYERISNGTFPEPVKISRASRWPLASVQAWIENAVEAGHAE